MAQPANDAPCSATTIPVGATCALVSYTVSAATNSAAGTTSCGAGNNDVWFKFVAPASGSVSLQTQAGTGGSGLQDGAMAVYTGCTGPFTLVNCDDGDFFDPMPELDLICLTPGQTYFVRFWKESGNASRVNFKLCATNLNMPAAANDEPCTATSLTVGSSCVNTLGTNVCATSSPVAAPSCANYQGGDVWFSFTVPASGAAQVTTNTASGSFFDDSGIALYTATNCADPNTFAEKGCNNDGNGSMSQLSVGCLTPGSTAYIRVWQSGNDEIGQFNICVKQLTFSGTPPANDDPCGAVNIPVVTASSCSSSTAATNVNARPSCAIPPSSCGDNTIDSKDVWFSFTAPPSGIIEVESTLGTLTDGVVALYSAPACTGPFQILACDDNTGTGTAPFLSYAQLTPGNTYYLRYWGVAGATGTFTLCLRTIALPATSCSYLLEMFDSNENGWGASAVEVSVNGGAFNAYTVTGAYNLAVFGTNTGGSIRFRYAVNGANGQSQNQYVIRQMPGGFPAFQSGPTPTPVSPAIAYQVDPITCVPPAGDPHDCAGSSTVCGSAGIQNGTVGTGFTQDLGPANRGCLSGERQGTWYIFSPTSSGTFGFTLVPNGNTDYDFAVWGPFTTVQCPPTGPPIRCSYAAPPHLNGYSTGLGSGATDLSEGAGGNGWVAPLNATAGQVYVLYVDNYATNGQQFNLNWNLGPGSSLDCSVTLPVELIELEANVKGSSVLVEWATASESNSDRFEVQRSADNSTFNTIGSVTAAGSSQQRLNYLFTDDAPIVGANYYRLKQVDIDGAFHITQTVVALFGRTGRPPLLFPNPALDVLHVAFEEPVDGYTYLYVRDALGRAVATTAALLERGERTVDLPTATLAPGCYSVRIASSTGAITNGGSFLKQ